MATDLHTFEQREFDRRLNAVIVFLKGQHGRRATRIQLIKGVGFTPDLVELISMEVIRRVDGPYDHFELVE